MNVQIGIVPVLSHVLRLCPAAGIGVDCVGVLRLRKDVNFGKETSQIFVNWFDPPPPSSDTENIIECNLFLSKNQIGRV